MSKRAPVHENISKRQACKLLRCGPLKLGKLIGAGYIREITILDQTWLKRADVERVLRDGTEPRREAAE